MAYEFFDDVAFYFVIQSLLTVFLLPPSLYYLYIFFSSRICSHGEKHDRKKALAGECSCADCSAKLKKGAEKSSLSDVITWKGVLLVLGWLLFIYLWIQLPQYEETELISFKPYEIMGLETTATEAEIKKQWRRLSVKLHPDKNPDDPEAHTKFLKLKKAYEALTDPVAMENMQKYGNPDGYQGISLTIGLPSWLTRKENEMRILLLYFLVMIVIPPIAVYYWYKNSQLYAESGVMNQSLWQFNQYIKEHMALKYFIEILAASAENLALRERQTVKKDITLLHNDVSDAMAKIKFEKDKFLWIWKCNVLWHAYLLRREIPVSLQFEMNHMLKHAHKLLEGMLNMSVMQKFYKPTLDIITLMQYVTQGCYLDEKHEKYQKQLPLKQLPHFTEEIVNKFKTAGISWRAFRDMEPEKRREVVSLSSQQWEEVEAVIARIPRIYMAYRYEVEEEEGIYQGDIVQLTVKLQRRRQGLKPEDLISPYEAGMEPGERTKTLRQRKEAQRTKSYEERLNDLPVGAKPKLPKQKGEAPWVHSLRFPFPKQEKWWIILIEHVKKDCDVCRQYLSVCFCPVCNKTFCPNCDGLVHKKGKQSEDGPSMEHPRFPLPSSRIAHIQKLGAFVDKEEVKIHLRPPFRGTFAYELHARCDSYLGSDSSAEFKIDVKQVDEIPEKKKEDEEGFEDDPVDEEEKPAEPKWYYCYCTSLFEMLANAAVLIALGFVLQNFLQQRGYWQKYVTPIFDRLLLLWNPIWKSIHPIVSPVYDPLATYASSLFSYLADTLTAMPPPPPVKPTA